MKKVTRMMIIGLVIVVLLLGCAFAYVYLNGLSRLHNFTEAKTGQIKVACVGDSITYGHGISNWPQNNYPQLLQNLLSENYHVNNYGVPGRAVQNSADKPYTETNCYQQSIDYDADILVFMMGTNDSKPENWCDEEKFREAVLTLLDSYLDRDIPPVVYLCTPATDYFTEGYTDNITEYDIQPEIVDVIADIINEIALERGYELIDIHALTAAHPEWFEEDGVHPNNEGAAAIAQLVFDTLYAINSSD